MRHMANLKVAVLYDVWEEEPEPAPTAARKRREDAGQAPRKKKKEKHDREEIFEALAKLGHEAVYQVVDGRTSRSSRSRARTPTSSST